MHFKLKDSRDAIIRSPRAEDVEGILAYLIKSAGETDFLLRYPEEWEQLTYEKEKELIEGWEKSDCQTMLTCEVDGVIVGTCMVSWNKGIKIGHEARVAIGLLKEYWNLGIGTKFFEEMMELEFIEGNTRARALYEKIGFKIVAMRPRAIRLKDGTLLSEYIMLKELK